MTENFGQELGRGHVSIFGDDSPFKRKVATLGRGLRRAVEIPVGAETRGAESKIAGLRRSLESIRDESVEVDVSTEQGRAQARLLGRELTNLSRRAWRLSLTVEDARARAQLRQITAAARAAARRVELRVDAETAGAQTKLAGLRTALAVLSKEVRVRVDVDADRMSTLVASTAAVRSGLDAGNSAITRFNRSVYTLGNVARVAARVGIFGLVGAIGPLVGIATLGGAALATLGGGLGLVAAAAMPTLNALDALSTAQGDVAKASKKLGREVTASELALYRQVLGFGASYRAAFAPATEEFNRLFSAVISLADSALPYLGGVAEKTVRGVSTVFEEMRGNWTGDRQLELFQRILQAVPGIFEDSARGALMFGTALANVVAAAIPYVEELAEYFGGPNGLAERFLRWTQSVEGQRQLQQFFEDASFYAGLFANIIADVARFLFRIGQSEGAQRVFQNIAGFVDWLATNRGVRRGLGVALGLLSRLGDVILFLLNVPGIGSGIGLLGTLFVTLALFGGGPVIAGVIALSKFGRALARIPGVSRLAGLAVSALRAPFVGIGRWAGAGVRAAAGWFARLPALVWRGLRGIGNLAARAFSGIGRGAWAAVRAAASALGRLPGLALRALRGIPGLVGRVFRAVPGVVTGIFRGAGRWFSPALSAASRFFGGRGALMGIFRFFAGRAGIGAIFGPAGLVLMVLLQFADQLNRFAQNLGRRIGDALNISWIGPWIADQLRRIVGPRIYDGIARIFGADLGELIRMVGKWLTSSFEWIGQSMIWGWISGIADRAGDLYNTLIDMAKRAWEAVRSFFESRSPSQLMRRLGQSLPQGAALGVEDEAPRFEEALSRMARAARDRMREHRIGIDLTPGYGSPGFTRNRTMSVRTVAAAPTSTPAPGAETREIGRMVSEAMRRAGRSLDEPIEVTIPVYVGGKKFEEYVVNVMTGEAREARRFRSPAPGGAWSGR